MYGIYIIIYITARLSDKSFYKNSVWHDGNDLRKTFGAMKHILLVTQDTKELPLISGLTQWSQDKIADILQMIFSNAFHWMEMIVFWLKFHCIMFPGV